MDIHSDREQEIHSLPEQGHPGVPRWVKVFALIALAVLLVFVVAMLLGGEHGPGLHSSFPVNPSGTPVYAGDIRS